MDLLELGKDCRQFLILVVWAAILFHAEIVRFLHGTEHGSIMLDQRISQKIVLE